MGSRSTPHSTGTYALTISAVPAQVFGLGALTSAVTSVSNGVPGVGAGNLETPVSEDDYTFSLSAVASVSLRLTCPSAPPSTTGEWNLFAAGSTAALASGQCTSASYLSASLPAGNYRLEITSNNTPDALGQYTLTVGAPSITNLVPVASFSSSVTGTMVTLDGSSSTDADGSVVGYAWTFGDSSTGSGLAPSHTYTTSGTYTVALTVTDNGAATNTVSHTVTVTVLAADSFTRTATSSWGTANTGGAWTVAAASLFSVGNGVGTMTLPAAPASGSAFLNTVASSDTDLHLSFAMDRIATGGGTFLTVTGRKVVGQGEYRAKVKLVAGGGVQIQLLRSNSANTETSIASTVTVAGLTYTAGMVLQVRMQVYGTTTTTLKARVWADGATEPSSWQVSTTDTTAGLQTTGSIGVAGYASTSTTNGPQALTFDTLNAQPTGL